MEILLALLAVVIGWVLWDHNQKQKAKASAVVAETAKAEEQAPYKVEPLKVDEIAAVAQVNSIVGASTLAAVAVAESKAEEAKPAKPARTKKPAAMKAKKPAATKKAAPKKVPPKKSVVKKSA